MENLATETISLLNYLLPGLFAAWIFHGLTSFVVPSTQTERVIQALILTAIIQVPVFVTGWFYEAVRPSGWTEELRFVWSMFFAVLLGHTFAFIANKDVYHRLWRDFPFTDYKCCKWLRGRKWFAALPSRLTKRTSYPSEWYRVFYNSERCVVLHFKGPNGRRLYGWAEEWPNVPDRGHFIITQPHWLSDENGVDPATGVERMIVPASEIEMVEFMYDTDTEERCNVEE
jgi:hypothetical protein